MKTVKKSVMCLLVLVAATSCTTYQYTSRETQVRQRAIDPTALAADLEVDYSRHVTATSEYQVTKKQAILEAEFKCIQASKIDVVVDAIYKIEYNPLRAKKRYKATIEGYAGMLKDAPAGVESSKQFTREEIENYKLLYDAEFPKYFYNRGEGDRYYFHCGESTESAPRSIMFKQKQLQRQELSLKPIDVDKALRVRNAGIGLTVAGVASMFVIGLPCLFAQETVEDDGYYYPSSRKAANSAGIAFMTIGGAAIGAGVPMWSIGAVRLKKAQKMDITLNASSNGLGVGLTF